MQHVEPPLLIFRIIVQLVGAGIAAYFVPSQINEGIAKICYMGPACFVEAHLSTSPNGFWVVIGVYVSGALVLLTAAMNDFQKLMRRG